LKTKLNKKLKCKNDGNLVSTLESNFLQPLPYKTHNCKNKIIYKGRFQGFIFAKGFSIMIHNNKYIFNDKGMHHGLQIIMHYYPYICWSFISKAKC
jgi:hypothetical protein